MNKVTMRKIFRSLIATALTAAAFSTPATAAESCACLCVEGAPYYVCNSFTGSTQQPTEACDAQLADACPAAPDTQTSTDPATEPDGVSEEPTPVNAAARANGLQCQPRQVYRPDLAEHKVYTVCMPEAMAQAKAKASGAQQARSSRSPR